MIAITLQLFQWIQLAKFITVSEDRKMQVMRSKKYEIMSFLAMLVYVILMGIEFYYCVTNKEEKLIGDPSFVSLFLFGIYALVSFCFIPVYFVIML